MDSLDWSSLLLLSWALKPPIHKELWGRLRSGKAEAWTGCPKSEVECTVSQVGRPLLNLCVYVAGQMPSWRIWSKEEFSKVSIGGGGLNNTIPKRDLH